MFGEVLNGVSCLLCYSLEDFVLRLGPEARLFLSAADGDAIDHESFRSQSLSVRNGGNEDSVDGGGDDARLGLGDGELGCRLDSGVGDAALD